MQYKIFRSFCSVIFLLKNTSFRLLPSYMLNTFSGWYSLLMKLYREVNKHLLVRPTKLGVSRGTWQYSVTPALLISLFWPIPNLLPLILHHKGDQTYAYATSLERCDSGLSNKKTITPKCENPTTILRKDWMSHSETDVIQVIGPYLRKDWTVFYVPGVYRELQCSPFKWSLWGGRERHM